jgi:prepilin-type N-terminal cleavage/methylation domain-containing protein
MKLRPATLRPQFAFTLIELITVIAIIAILMALLFPAISGAKDSARRGKAGTVVRSIVNACKNYQNDYGKFPPVPGASNGGGTGGATSNIYSSFGDMTNAHCKVNNNELFDVLRAIDRGSNAQHVLNRRQQKYFEEGKATDIKNPREGFADGKDFDDKVQGQLLDPWGTQYCIVLDGDGDETLKMTDFYSDLSDDVRFSAVAFSLGKNGDLGGKGYKSLRKPNSTEAPDDIVSWQ